MNFSFLFSFFFFHFYLFIYFNFIIFFLMETSEQLTGTNLGNFVYSPTCFV